MSDAPDDFLTLPVRVSRGQLVVCGPTLALREGATGEVRLPRDAMTRDLGRDDQSSVVRALLPAETEVRFLVRADRVPPQLLSCTLPCAEAESYHLSGRRKTPALFVSAVLTQPLQRQRLQNGHAVLRGGACRIGCLDVHARSLHHAYTLISEKFEPHRLAHDGNAFDKAHILRGEKWLPLRAVCFDDAEVTQSAPRSIRVRTATKRRDTSSGSLFG